ncbi:Hypothetical protein, putative, partial [Bodo saltans]
MATQHLRDYDADFAKQQGSGIHTFTDEHKQKNRQALQLLTDLIPFADINKTNDCDLVYRYLIARKWDVDEAVKSIKEYLRWRNDERIDEVMWESVDASVQEMIATFSGLDREGYPILWDAPNPKLVASLLKTTPKERIIRAHYKMMESARFLSRTNNVDRITYVLDLTTVTMSSVNGDSIGILKEMSKLDQQYYPEVMRRMLICNGGWVVNAAWKVLRPLLDERVQKKIQFLKDAPSVKVLGEYIQDDRVHSKYGGVGQGKCGPFSKTLAEQLTFAVSGAKWVFQSEKVSSAASLPQPPSSSSNPRGNTAPPPPVRTPYGTSNDDEEGGGDDSSTSGDTVLEKRPSARSATTAAAAAGGGASSSIHHHHHHQRDDTQFYSLSDDDDDDRVITSRVAAAVGASGVGSALVPSLKLLTIVGAPGVLSSTLQQQQPLPFQSITSPKISGTESSTNEMCDEDLSHAVVISSSGNSIHQQHQKSQQATSTQQQQVQQPQRTLYNDYPLPPPPPAYVVAGASAPSGGRQLSSLFNSSSNASSSQLAPQPASGKEILTPGRLGDGFAVEIQIQRHGKVIRGFHQSRLVGETQDNLIVSYDHNARVNPNGPGVLVSPRLAAAMPPSTGFSRVSQSPGISSSTLGVGGSPISSNALPFPATPGGVVSSSS